MISTYICLNCKFYQKKWINDYDGNPGCGEYWYYCQKDNHSIEFKEECADFKEK